jgi:hypothetical protein
MHHKVEAAVGVSHAFYCVANLRASLLQLLQHLGTEKRQSGQGWLVKR